MPGSRSSAQDLFFALIWRAVYVHPPLVPTLRAHPGSCLRVHPGSCLRAHPGSCLRALLGSLAGRGYSETPLINQPDDCAAGHYDGISLLGGRLRLSGGRWLLRPHVAGAAEWGPGLPLWDEDPPSQGFIPKCTGRLWEPTQWASGQRSVFLLI